MNNNPILMQQLLNRLGQLNMNTPTESLNNNINNLLAFNDYTNKWREEQNRALESQYRQAHPVWGWMKYDAPENPLTVPFHYPYMIKAELENLQKNYINPKDYGEQE